MEKKLWHFEVRVITGGENGTIFPGKSDTTFRWFLICVAHAMRAIAGIARF